MTKEREFYIVTAERMLSGSEAKGHELVLRTQKGTSEIDAVARFYEQHRKDEAAKHTDRDLCEAHVLYVGLGPGFVLWGVEEQPQYVKTRRFDVEGAVPIPIPGTK